MRISTFPETWISWNDVAAFMSSCISSYPGCFASSTPSFIGIGHDRVMIACDVLVCLVTSRARVYWYSDLAGGHGLFWEVWRLLAIDYFFSGQKVTRILGSMTSRNHVQIPLLRSRMWFLDYPTIDYSFSAIIIDTIYENQTKSMLFGEPADPIFPGPVSHTHLSAVCYTWTLHIQLYSVELNWDETGVEVSTP